MKKIAVFAVMVVAFFSFTTTAAAGESINLTEGKNLVSLPLQPPNASVEAVLAQVLDKVKAVKGYDNSSGRWLKYKPGGEKSTLANIGQGMPLQISMTEPGVINMAGWQQSSPVVQLHSGKNIVGYAGPEGRVLDSNYIKASGLSGFISFKDYDDKSTPTVLRRGGIYAVKVPKGRSLIWNQDPQPPMAPVLTAQAGDGQITLNWENVPGALSYNLYWAESGVTNIISGVEAPFAHTGLVNGRTYYYILTAVNYAGESEASDEVSATPHSPPWTLPGGAKAEFLADDGSGELFVSGTTVGNLGEFINPNPGYSDVFIAGFNADGQMHCLRQIGTFLEDAVPRIAFWNGILYSAWTQDLPGLENGNVNLSIFDANCNELSRRLVAANSTVLGIAVNESGIYLLVTNIIEGKDFIFKLNHSGDTIFSRPMEPYGLFSSSIALEANYIYVSGTITGSLPGFSDQGWGDIFLIKYIIQEDGLAMLWGVQWGSENTDFGHSVGISPDGEKVFVGGMWNSCRLNGNCNSDGEDVLLGYDDQGNSLFVNNSFTVDPPNYVYQIFVADDGIYATRAYNSPVKFTFDGNLVWRGDLQHDGRLPTVRVINDVVFVVNGSNVVLRYNATTGELL